MNKITNTPGRVTIPTDQDIIPQTLEILNRWGADAIRDCDGTEFPAELADSGAKIYATYYTTRKDNQWARDNPDEIQQCYLSTGFRMAGEEADRLSIRLLEGVSEELLRVNSTDDLKRWWEVIDRTAGQVVAVSDWSYREADGTVVIEHVRPYHEYSVSFLAYLIWDPVHMYNAVINEWKDFEPQLTFDVRQPKTRAYSLARLRKFLAANPQVDVVRFTTFFHQFTLIFDELKRSKYVDWYGYSASVSPYILEQFEKEVAYPFRAEYIIDEGYYNSQYRIPSREYQDFMAFQRREVAKLAREMVDITHEFGKEAMMFLGDHFIGTEPYLEEFAAIGLDAVVGSVGNGSTLRLISDIKGVRYTEGRLLPYFFPDTFHDGGDPLSEARENWLCARRAIMRSPIDRIGYGGYLKLALDFPDFLTYVETVCNEFRRFYDNVKGAGPFCFKRVAVLNCWGKARAWGCHMVHHALYQKQNYSYAGVIEALAGAPYEVSFISFDDLRRDPDLQSIDVLINVGDQDTAHSGGEYWADVKIVTAIRRFIARGGGFIGVGEPSAHQWQGRRFQLGAALGVEKETGFTLGYDKYNWAEQAHFITAETTGEPDFGEAARNIYAFAGTAVLIAADREVRLAANEYGQGRTVYFGGLPYSAENARLLHRAILWCTHAEDRLEQWWSVNPAVDVHAYPDSGRYCVCNNSYQPQQTTVFDGTGHSFAVDLTAGELRWYQI